MPPPTMFPCGKPGFPACPPVPAADTLAVLSWFSKLSQEHKLAVQGWVKDCDPSA